MPDVNGLTGDESWPRNVTDPSKGSVPVNDHGYDVGPDDPCHGHWCTDEGIFGIKGPDNMTGTPTMQGFVQNAIRIGHNETNPVSMFAPENVPISELPAIISPWWVMPEAGDPVELTSLLPQ